MKNLRSKDPRPGDRVKILLEDSIWHGLVGTIRHVYKNTGKPEVVVSIVVHPSEATDFIRQTVPVAPDGGFHTMALSTEIDIIQRRIYG